MRLTPYRNLIRLKKSIETQSVPNPDQAAEVADWVLTARVGVEKVTSDPEVRRVIVAKKEWLERLLNTGKDEEGNLVIGLSAWDTKSWKVIHDKPHKNHMHIELKVAKPTFYRWWLYGFVSKKRAI